MGMESSSGMGTAGWGVDGVPGEALALSTVTGSSPEPKGRSASGLCGQDEAVFLKAARCRRSAQSGWRESRRRWLQSLLFKVHLESAPLAVAASPREVELGGTGSVRVSAREFGRHSACWGFLWPQ